VASRVVLTENGIMVYDGEKKISLDPSRAVDCDITFVSHAHVDHLHKRSKKYSSKSIVLASAATSSIAHARGYDIEDISEKHDGFELIDTGHILGSKGLLIGDETYYTGDISIRERAFMKPAQIPQAKTLIIESTFGRPQYIFPKLSEIVHRTNKLISEMYSLGVPVILMGYPLGKAQLLTELFKHWEPLYVHDSIHKMNSVYTSLGIRLKATTAHTTAEKGGLLSKSKPWLMISPLTNCKSKFIKEIRERHGAITIGFSGWGIDSHYKYMLGLDHIMPVSDHCDFRELVEVVKKCNPKKIYTFHGFARDFAACLRKLGFDAHPIEPAKTKHKYNANSLDMYT